MRARVAAALADLRALGAGAPLRAVYETSKRAGGHDLLFGRLRTRPPGSAAAVWSLPAGVPPEARARTLQDAAQVHAGVTHVFGRPVDPRTSPHVAPDTGGEWGRDHWWRVDIRSEDRIADVKWTWELARHRHLLVLARAAWLEPEDASHLALLTTLLADWLVANPVEEGVHWYSNLEIALRALVWLQVLQLLEGRLPGPVRAGLELHLAHSGRHLVVDLPYTVTSMRNNHMLGDALGLIALGKAFDRPSWVSIGDRLFEGQLGRHMRADGSMIEDSLSYHRFVTEMLAVRVLVGDASPQTRRALRASGEHLVRLGVLDAPVPQFGDWDEGRVLTSSGDPLDVSGCAALSLSLSGSGAPEHWRERYDECAWYAPTGEPAPLPVVHRDGRAVGGGFAGASAGSWHALLKAGGGTSHQHADLCSTVLRLGDQWVVGDPGTGTYNGPLEQRNAFRTSQAHSVLRLDGEDQLLPHRAFRWTRSASGVVGPPPQVPDAVVMWGVHDAYRASPTGGRVARLVVLTEGAMTVADVVERPGGRYDLTLPLHPAVVDDGTSLALPDGTPLRVVLPSPPQRLHGEQGPYQGWWSDTYGSAVPTTWLRASGPVEGAVRWAVTSPDTEPAEVLTDGLRHVGVDLRVRFTVQGAVLAVDGPGALQQTLFARCALG